MFVCVQGYIACGLMCMGRCLHMFIHIHIPGEKMKATSFSSDMDRKEEDLCSTGVL